MRTSRSFSIVALGFGVLACASADGGAGDVSVRDSAGIQIVESASPRWTDGTRWRVEPEPIVDLGGGESPAEPFLFQRIVGIMRLDDGRLLVADGQASELRFYDAEGRHLRTAGRKGRGPGEMQVIYDIWRRQGDTLVASAFGAELNEFTSEGEFVRRWRAPVPAESPSGIVTTDLVLGDGSLIVSRPLQIRVSGATTSMSSMRACIA